MMFAVVEKATSSQAIILNEHELNFSASNGTLKRKIKLHNARDITEQINIHPGLNIERDACWYELVRWLQNIVKAGLGPMETVFILDDLDKGVINEWGLPKQPLYSFMCTFMLKNGGLFQMRL